MGKLEIDEKVAQGIENRITGKKKWQKPAAPIPEPKSILKRDEVGEMYRLICLLNKNNKILLVRQVN